MATNDSSTPRERVEAACDALEAEVLEMTCRPAGTTGDPMTQDETHLDVLGGVNAAISAEIDRAEKSALPWWLESAVDRWGAGPVLASIADALPALKRLAEKERE